jgi:hypothetical protein
MATPPIPRLRPEVLAAIIQQMQMQSQPLPRLRPEPDQLGTGNTNMMPRLRPSAEQQPPLPTPPLPMPTAADPNLMASPAPRPTYSDTSIRRMREADYRVRLAKDEPAGGGKEGTGHGPAGAHPQRRQQPPRGPLQGKATQFPQVAGPLSTGQPYKPQSQAALRGLLAPPGTGSGRDFGSGFAPAMDAPAGFNEAVGTAILRQKLAAGGNQPDGFSNADEFMRLILQAIGEARIEAQPTPWLKQDASAGPETPTITSPSGMYR